MVTATQAIVFVDDSLPQANVCWKFTRKFACDVLSEAPAAAASARWNAMNLVS